MRYFFLFLCFVFISQLNAQKWLDSSDYFPTGSYREVGLNMTPLATMLVPFNRSNPKLVGPYMMKFHRYKDNKFFRSAIGVDLGDIEFDGTQSHFNVRFGWGKRRLMHERFAFLSTFDITASLGDLNLAGSKDQDGIKLAIGPTWGIQYAINTMVNVGTETSLLLGAAVGDFSGVVFEFIPPVAIYLNMRLPEKGRRKKRP